MISPHRPVPTLAILLMLAAVPSRADVLYDSGVAPADVQDSLFSDPSFFLGASYAGDEFTLATDSTLTGFEWTGLYAVANTPGDDDFTLAIFDFSGATPGLTPLLTFAVGPADGRSDTGLSVSGFTLYGYSATVAPTALAAGHYLLSIVNDTTADSDDDWGWGAAIGNLAAYSRGSATAPWVEVADRTTDFTVLGTAVPEPSSIALTAMGLGLLTLAVRRRRSA